MVSYSTPLPSNDKMKKADKEQLDRIFSLFVKLFQSRCYTCRGKYTTKQAFVIHHRSYRSNEKTYKDFNKDKLAYYRYLLPIIIQHHKEFRLLHYKHHYLVETWARLKPEHFERTVKVSREINKRKYNK